MKVLMVCTGNLCRSPMAMALLQNALERRDCSNVEVVSAGTWADDGYPASEGAVSLLRMNGIDLSEHRSRPLDPEEVVAADLIVAMTRVHVQEVLEVAPGAGDKLVMLKEIPEIALGDELPPDRSERLRRLLAGTRPEPRRSLDVDDPIGLPAGAYERCLADLRRGVDALVEVVCP